MLIHALSSFISPSTQPMGKAAVGIALIGVTFVALQALFGNKSAQDSEEPTHFNAVYGTASSRLAAAFDSRYSVDDDCLDDPNALDNQPSKLRGFFTRKLN